MHDLEKLDAKIQELEERMENIDSWLLENGPTMTCSRITGYHRFIEYWNDGKREEYQERLEYDINKKDLSD